MHIGSASATDPALAVAGERRPPEPASPAGAAARPDRQLQGALAQVLSHLTVALVALVAIGGATRVMQAGLACPDWPLCYGSLLPGRQMTLQVFLEWFHRLDAFVVGVGLLVVSGVSLIRRRRLPVRLPWFTGLALLLVALQGALGALTVRHLLASDTVTAHLLTALLLVLLVAACAQALQAGATQPAAAPLPRWWLPLLGASTLLLLGQCGLGAAMASRWASSLCLSSAEGCRWLLLHRLGAWPALTGLLLPALGALLLPDSERPLRRLAAAPALLAPLQVALGILTLRLQLADPLVTVAHQVLAATLVALIGALWGRSAAHLVSGQTTPRQPTLEMAHG